MEHGQTGIPLLFCGTAFVCDEVTRKTPLK